MFIDRENVLQYVARLGLARPESVRGVEFLGWGVSNTVVKVVHDGGCLVLKQSLPRLRVQDDWFADRERIYREEACIRLLERLLPPGTVPRVLASDPANFAFAMTCAPEDGRVWKEMLLKGRVDHGVARLTGATLGLIHASTHGDEAVREAFIDDRPFVQLRIDPYHYTTARRHPDLAPAINREAEKMLRVKTCLVHGDYSPKNVIVYEGGRRIFLLDFEVVHYGNPVFDLAFCLNHLFLKAIHRPQDADLYVQSARAFWQAYLEEAPFTAGELEADTVRQMACLMLARVDGKSPVEYLTDPRRKDTARSLARHLLLGNADTPEGAVEALKGHIAREVVPYE